MNTQYKTTQKASAPETRIYTYDEVMRNKMEAAQSQSGRGDQPQHSPSPQRWQAQIDDLCVQRNDYKNHADKLAEALHRLDMAHNHETLCRAKEHARATLKAWKEAQQ